MKIWASVHFYRSPVDCSIFLIKQSLTWPFPAKAWMQYRHFLDIFRNNPGKFAPNIRFPAFFVTLCKRGRAHWEHLVHVWGGWEHVRCVGAAAGDSCVLCFIWHGDALSSSSTHPTFFLFFFPLFFSSLGQLRAVLHLPWGCPSPPSPPTQFTPFLTRSKEVSGVTVSTACRLSAPPPTHKKLCLPWADCDRPPVPPVYLARETPSYLQNLRNYEIFLTSWSKLQRVQLLYIMCRNICLSWWIVNYLDLDQVLSTCNWPIHILTIDPDHWLKSTGDRKHQM